MGMIDSIIPIMSEQQAGDVPGVLSPQECEALMSGINTKTARLYERIEDPIVESQLGSFSHLDTSQERTPQQELILIEDLVKQLDQYKVETNNDECTQARRRIADILLPYYDDLVTRSIVPVLYGSLIYGDPQNLDADIAFGGKNLFMGTCDMQLGGASVPFKDWANQYVIKSLHDKPTLWPRQSVAGHFTMCDLTEVSSAMRRADEYSPITARAPEGDIGEMGRQLSVLTEKQEISDALGSASLFLTGSPVDPRFQSGLDGLRREIRDLLSQSQWLRWFVLNDLLETVDIRKKRREDGNGI